MTASDSATVDAGAELVVERGFDAPRELVWRAWTDPALMMRWWGPEGMTSPACEIDLSVGGRYLLGMRSPDGYDHWIAGVYHEIVPLERFVATESMADEHGNVDPSPAYGMGEKTLTVTFEDAGDGSTKLTVRQAGWPDLGMAAGASAGYNQALDKLAAALADM